MNEFDLNAVGSFGIGGVLLLLAYRLLMRQTTGWETLAAAERALSADLRRELDEVREEARSARKATEDCEAAHQITRDQLDHLIQKLLALGLDVS